MGVACLIGGCGIFNLGGGLSRFSILENMLWAYPMHGEERGCVRVHVCVIIIIPMIIILFKL